MVEEGISPAKSAIRLGNLFGVFMILEFVVVYAIDTDPLTNPSIGYTINTLNYLLLPICLIIIGVNSYKNKWNSGFVSFGECLKIGVVICLIASLLYVLFTVVFNFIFPEYIEEIIAKTRVVVASQNPDKTNEQIDLIMKKWEKSMEPIIAIPSTIAKYSFIGLFYSLLIGLLFKNDKPESY